MTTDKWKDKWVKSCEGMSNVTIVCNDGIVHSHKIIIAIVSEFIKDIMITIPVADDVTIFLPDFQTAHINSVIDQFIFGGKKSKTKIPRYRLYPHQVGYSLLIAL